MTAEFVLESCVRGHNVYKNAWTPNNRINYLAYSGLNRRINSFANYYVVD